MADSQDLKAALDWSHLERSDTARLGQVYSIVVGHKINLARGGIDGKRARPFARGQVLNHGIGVGDRVLTDDGDASVAGAIGDENQPAVPVVSDRLVAGAGGQRCDRIAGARIQNQKLLVAAG